MTSFKESLEQALRDETLDDPTKAQMRMLMRAYNDIAHNCVVFMDVEPIFSGGQKKEQREWLKYKHRIEEGYSTPDTKRAEIPARIIALRHKYGALIETVAPNLNCWCEEPPSIDKRSSHAARLAASNSRPDLGI